MYNEVRFNKYIKSNVGNLGVNIALTLFLVMFYVIISAYDNLDATTLNVFGRTLFVSIVLISIVKSMIKCVKLFKLMYNKNKYLNA